jgi:hypothetical protein
MLILYLVVSKSTNLTIEISLNRERVSEIGMPL